jgi:hypothetical protein
MRYDFTTLLRNQMLIRDIYSHKNGEDFITKNHSNELQEIKDAVANIDAIKALCKKTDEKTKPPLLFSPKVLNEYLKKYLCEYGWTEKAPGSSKGFKEPRIYLGDREFREMDGIKNKVGLEIQFGKYAFMGYDIFSKMPIFNKQGLIECGIELVAMPSIVKNMSTGVSSFNQIVMDMKARGVADLDLPTIIVGIDCDENEWRNVDEKRQRYKEHPTELIANGEVRAGRHGAKPGPKDY